MNLTISPSVAQIDLATDSPSYLITYQNFGPEALFVRFSTQDYFSEAVPTWLSLSTNSFTLDPGETANLRVFIDPNRLPPGTHYARIEAVSATAQTTNQIAIAPSLTSLLSVTSHTGKEIEAGKIVNFEPGFSFKFQNLGNVELVPHGILEIKDVSGRLTQRGVVNEDSLVTYPANIRSYNVTATDLPLWRWPGPYQATLTVNYGKGLKNTSADLTYWSTGSLTPTQLVLAGVVLLLLLIKLYRGQYLVKIWCQLRRLARP